MTEAMKFVNFETENHLYALKFLGNVYVLLRTQTRNEGASVSAQLKEMVLRAVVRYKLRVFNNIMVWEGWVDELEQAKVEVGFDALRDRPSEGIRILYECSSNNRSLFVKMLSEREEYIARLEDMLSQNETQDNMLLEMLNIFYESA